MRPVPTRRTAATHLVPSLDTASGRHSVGSSGWVVAGWRVKVACRGGGSVAGSRRGAGCVAGCVAVGCVVA